MLCPLLLLGGGQQWQHKSNAHSSCLPSWAPSQAEVWEVLSVGESWAVTCISLEEAGVPSGKDCSESVKTEDDSSISAMLRGVCKSNLESPIISEVLELRVDPSQQPPEGSLSGNAG